MEKMRYHTESHDEELDFIFNQELDVIKNIELLFTIDLKNNLYIIIIPEINTPANTSILKDRYGESIINPII